MTEYAGDFAEDATVYIPFNTFDSNDPSASVTITNLADADIKVHKDGSATEIVTDGATVAIDFDSITGNHLITIDTSVDAAYTTGSEYQVRIEGTTVDGATINAWVGSFSIERSGGALALLLEVQGATFNNSTDSLEAIRDRGDAAWTTGAGGSDRLLMVDTTIATLATQVSFTLNAGSADDGAYNNCTIIIEDVATSAQKSLGMVLDYVGSSKTVTLKEALAFTIATTDKVYILAENSLKSTVANRQLNVAATGETDADIISISGDAPAADNLEAMYDGTGYIDDTAPASRDQVGQLGGGSSSGFNYAVSADNTGGAIIDGVVFVGSQTGTFANTAANPATFHEIDHTGNAIDLVYRISVGSVNQAISVAVELFLNSNNDVLDVQLYDHNGTTWETQFTLVGKNGSTIDGFAIRPLAKHTGALGSAEAGNLYIRFVTTAQSSPTLFIATCIAEAVAANSSMGYEAGSVYCDEAQGTSTGTLQGTDGIFANQSDDFDNALTIATNLGSSLLTVRNNNSIQLTSSIIGFTSQFNGSFLDFNGQNIGGSVFIQVGDISGVATSLGPPCFFLQAFFGIATLPPSLMQFCGFNNTFTMGSAGDFTFTDCFNNITGGGVPTFTKVSGQAVKCVWLKYSGGLTISNIEAGDSYQISGPLGIITLNGVDGSVEVLGIYKDIIDNRTGSPVLTTSGAMKASDLSDILVDTTEIGTAGAGLNDLGGMSTAMQAEVNAEVDTALTDYDAPTNAELIARTLVAASYFDPAADTVANVTLVATTTTNTDMRGTDSAATAANLATVDSNVDAILVDTSTTLPGIIDDLAVKKNTALSNFEFLMVLSSDHVTPATGLTVTGQRSIDGGAFTGVTGTIAEVSNGIYQFDAVAADTNGDLISWRFSSATADDTFVTFKTVQ